MKEKAYTIPQKNPILVTSAFAAAREVLGKNQTKASNGIWEMVFPTFLVASYTRCIKINFLNAILQRESVIISISQLGCLDTDRINNLPKLLQQSTKERKREKKPQKTKMLECLVKILICGPFLLAGEMSWRRRLVAPAQPPQAELGFRVRKQPNVWLSIWRVFAPIKLLSLES